MKKVVEILNNMGMGGAEILVVNYAEFINKSEFEFVVIVGDKERNTPNEAALKRLGIKIYYMGNKLQQNVPKWNIPAKLMRKNKREKLFYEVLAKEQPDVIHAHQHVNQYVYQYVKKQKKAPRLFYTVHSLPEHIFRVPAEKKITHRLIHEYGMKLIALQNDAAKELNEMFGIDDAIVINNGIDADKFREAKKSRTEYRKMLGIPENSTVIGNVGRMNWIKNQSFLIDVFAEYKKTNPDAYLLIVGNGELKKELQDKIDALGFGNCAKLLSDRSDVPELMATMDVFVFPSLHEGFGLVVIEAQASGLKCVISDKVPQDTYVGDRLSVVGTDDTAKAWAEAIDDENNFVEAKFSPEKYDIKEIVKELEKLYCGEDLNG